MLRSSDASTWAARLPTMTLAERAKLQGVSANRAPQLSAGAILADAAMDLFEFPNW